MNCTPSVSEENELTLLAMELIAHDAYELFQDLKVKIQWLVQEDEVGDIFQNWSRKDIDSFLYYIKETFNQRYCVVHCYKPFFVLFRCDNQCSADSGIYKRYSTSVGSKFISWRTISLLIRSFAALQCRIPFFHG